MLAKARHQVKCLRNGECTVFINCISWGSQRNRTDTRNIDVGCIRLAYRMWSGESNDGCLTPRGTPALLCTGPEWKAQGLLWLVGSTGSPLALVADEVAFSKSVFSKTALLYWGQRELYKPWGVGRGLGGKLHCWLGLRCWECYIWTKRNSRCLLVISL